MDTAPSSDVIIEKMKGKLVIFIGTLRSGGAERVVSEVSAMYADYFKEVIVLSYYDTEVFYKFDSRVRLECVERQTKSTSMLKNILWIRHFVKSEHPDMFLSFLLRFNILSIWALMFLSTPVAVCERSDPHWVSTRWLRWMRNFSYRFCKRIQVQTAAGKTCFPLAVQNKILVIPNPNHISVEERNMCLKQVKEKRIVTVGRLIPVKNHKLLIDAFSVVNKEFPDYTLDFYGGGGLKTELQKSAIEQGLEKKVIFHGRQDCHAGLPRYDRDQFSAVRAEAAGRRAGSFRRDGV